MKKLNSKGKGIICFDVDDTLVIYDFDKEKYQKESVVLKTGIEGSNTRVLLPNTPTIELLKSAKRRGHFVIVWSAGGEHWAFEAVKKLKLTKYVDFVMEKPGKCIDDLPTSHWMMQSLPLIREGFTMGFNGIIEDKKD